MKVGVPRETASGERRVALVPDAVAKLVEAGNEVVVERRAGTAASFDDDAYTAAGAQLGDPWNAEVVAKVQGPSADETERLGDGTVLVGFLQPLSNPEGIERLASRGVVAFAME